MAYNIKELQYFITPERLTKMKQVINERTRYLTMVMENLYDPGNTSAVIRTCDAFGIQDMHIIELDNEFHTCTKVTQGAHKWVSLHKYNSTKKAVTGLKEKGYKIYFADPRPEYPSLDELPLDDKVAIVFGQEKRGITNEMKELADGGFRIPLYGFVESFNVSVSCALTIYELIKRLRKEKKDNFHISLKEKKEIFNHWLIKNTSIGKTLDSTKQFNCFNIDDNFFNSIENLEG